MSPAERVPYRAPATTPRLGEILAIDAGAYVDEKEEQLAMAAMYDELSKRDGERADELEYTVTRTQDDGLLFSLDALKAMRRNVLVFTGARMVAYDKKHGHGPKKMRAEIRLVFDEEGD